MIWVCKQQGTNYPDFKTISISDPKKVGINLVFPN